MRVCVVSTETLLVRLLFFKWANCCILTMTQSSSSAFFLSTAVHDDSSIFCVFEFLRKGCTLYTYNSSSKELENPSSVIYTTILSDLILSKIKRLKFVVTHYFFLFYSSKWCSPTSFGYEDGRNLKWKMLIKEYRIPLPMTVEEYKIAQLYMIAKKSREETKVSNSKYVIVYSTVP